MNTPLGNKESAVAEKLHLIVNLTTTALETYMQNDPDDVYGLINKELLYDNVVDIIADQVKSNLKM